MSKIEREGRMNGIEEMEYPGYAMFEMELNK